MDESTVVRHAANRDAEAWESLVVLHQEAVFRLAYLLLGDPDEAEDIAQEALLRAWKQIGKFDPSRPLRPWLLSITANLVRNRRRSAGHWTIEMGAPNLSKFTASPQALHLRLKDPASVKSDTKMPDLGLSEAEIESLISFINTK